MCQACRRGFTVERLGPGASAVRCPYCGREVDPYHGGETVVMSASSIPLPETAKAGLFTAETVVLPRDSRPALRASGSMIAGYRLEAVLTRTPLGTVYEAEQVNLHRRVSLYQLEEGLARDPVRAEAFLSEARKAAALVHPHIAAIYHVERDRETYFVVSELVRGESFFTRFQEQRLLRPRETVQYGAAIARSLAAAHAQEVCHWSLSPVNVFLDARGSVRVTNFAIARALFAGKDAPPRADFGAFGPCIAPEILAGGPATAR
ncbi:MAG: protein kinase, partial [Planctomycetota bacterium]